MAGADGVDGADEAVLVDRRHHRVHLLVEGAEDRHLIAMAGDIGAHLLVHIAAIGGQHADAPRAERVEGGKGGADRVRDRGVRLCRGKALRDPVGAKHDRGRGAAIGQHIEPVAGKDARGRVGQQRLHRRQRLRRHPRVVGDAGHEQIDTFHRDHGAEFVFDGVVGGQHNQPDPCARADHLGRGEGKMLDQRVAAVGRGLGPSGFRRGHIEALSHRNSVRVRRSGRR